MPPIIRIRDLHYTYHPEGSQPVQALRGVTLDVQPGEYVVVLGHNGSGKSTLAKHLNGLLLPTQGEVWIKDWNTRERDHLRDVRATVGMVFQTPDNQIVATIVEEDVAFGPENLGLPHAEIVRRVDWALDRVEMSQYRSRAPHLLSGGQKQRICIAGTLAMKPEVLVLDEATAMLDPLGRREVLEVVHRLHRDEGVTVVAITHHMDEAVRADRVIVMEAGRIVLHGPPREVFRHVERLRALQMDVPQVTQAAAALAARRPDFPADLLDVDELVAALEARLPAGPPTPQPAPAPAVDAASATVIRTEQLVHFYMRGTPLEVKAIHDISLEVRQGEILGVIGHTGSGKSTIVQHFNGLLRPHGGRVVVFDQDLGNPQLDVRALRRRVGLVFQAPEAQLFEQYVGDDVAYGPRNLKLSAEDVRARVRAAMEAVGLGFDAFKDRLTFGLSGGQMRRVALAGVLALQPEVLVLDEPTAGLDPRGREQLWQTILALHAGGLTLVVISHNMEELARFCTRLCVIAEGRTVLTGAPAEVYSRPAELRALGLGVPQVTEAFARLQAAGRLAGAGVVLTVEQAVEQAARALTAAEA
ncbi:MAG: energy-coupling factor transporter ATPase [Anaerolineales bacterium]|nr:energy-coupling factor transporter ATPase [Anaerolineales bacterium]